MSCRAICKATAGIIIASVFAIGAVLPVHPAPTEPTPITPSHITPAMATKPPAEPVEEASVAAVVATPEPTPVPTLKPTVMSTQHIASASLNSSDATHREWARTAGFPDSVWSCLDTLVKRESGWRVNATNPSSGAYGIPQSLPASKLASAGSDWQTNPVTQLRWMLSYVNARYGGICNALAHSNQTGWY